MKVHWKHKWLSIPYQGSQITLFGENVALPARSVIQVCTVNVVAHPSVQAVLPTEIQQLIDEFAALFEVSTDLPLQGLVIIQFPWLRVLHQFMSDLTDILLS
jgi:hypothetical protein